jgi:hypothetical protein
VVAAGLIDEDGREKNDKDNARRALAIALDMVLSSLPPSPRPPVPPSPSLLSLFVAALCRLSVSPFSRSSLSLSFSPGRPPRGEVCAGKARSKVARRAPRAQGGMRGKRCGKRSDGVAYAGGAGGCGAGA